MRVLKTLVVGALLASMAFAQSRTAIQKASAGKSSRDAVFYASPEERLSMWIWSDKYVYKAGDALTLRWTVKTNNDLYPYTVFAYRQNNQNGKKLYYPGATETVTDIGGNTLEQGFAAQKMSDATKAVVVGSGGLFPAITIPSELGMHTIAIELRDYTGTRVLKTSYMKISVVDEEVNVTGALTADTTWVSTKSYILQGIVTVKNNATLTIQPGTIVRGAPGSQPPSVLLVTRNGKLNAAGTKSRPIIMTSDQPFGTRKRGDWGGLLMLGKAPINVGANISGGATCGNTGCNNQAGEFYIEGLVANDDGLYGGADPTHNCGTMTYMRVEYAGSILSPNNETNSFTWGGCGTSTVAHHLQAIYGQDDSFEWFGGTMDAKYLVGGLGADDYVDFQLGYTGRIQYGLFYQSPDQKGNRGIEGDNSEYDNAATPYSNPTMYNLTFVGSGVPGYDEANAPGIFLRRGSRGSFYNMVVSNFYSSGVEITDANTQAQMDAGNIKMDGILMWKNNIGGNGDNSLGGQIANEPTRDFAAGTRAAGNAKNFVVADPMLRRPFEYSDPDWRGMFGSPIFRAGWVSAPEDGFFDQTAKFIGGIGDEDWTDEWTSYLVETDIAQ
jgi:hypothetical protein